MAVERDTDLLLCLLCGEMFSRTLIRNPPPKFPDGGPTCRLHYVSTLPTYSDSSLGTLSLEIILADIIGDDRHKKGKKIVVEFMRRHCRVALVLN